MNNLFTVFNSIPLTGVDSSKKFFVIAGGVCFLLMVIFAILKFKNKG